MRSVIKTHTYKRDFVRESGGKYRAALADNLPAVIEMLAADIFLPDKYRAHALTGKWAGYGECHIKPDLLLIYLKIDYAEDIEGKSGELCLIRLGSHSDLFG